MPYMTPPPRWPFALALAALVLFVASACSGDDAPAPADTPTASPTEPATAPRTATPVTAAASPAPPAATATTSPTSSAATPRPTPRSEAPLPTGTTAPPAAPAPGERTAVAPIEAIDVIWSDTAPRQYWVDVTSGLPDGCARFGGIQVARAGTTITLTVTNLTSAAPNRACTQLYGYVSTTVALGTDFTSGTRYTIRANDTQETFIAP